MVNTNPSNSMRFRVKIVMTAVFIILFTVVGVNFFKISVVDNEKYQEMANDQHFGSITIPAHRGSIYDAKGSALARSASVYRIFLDPKNFRQEMETLGERIEKRNAEKAKGSYTPKYDEEGNELDVLPESVDAFKKKLVSYLSKKLDITTSKVEAAMEEKTQYSILQDQVEKPVADEILKYFNDLGLYSINEEEDTKRYYPQNELAASVIGFTTGDGYGAYGVEAYYDDYLAGVDGKTISAKDSAGNELPYRYSKTYEPVNGDDVYLTLDMMIQHYLEKHLQEMVEKFEIKNRACAILMNAKTGAILGMATNPSFDLNDPREITDPNISAQLALMKGEEAEKKKGEEREKQWKNKCITEIYEPGSVFKVITSASAIEENLIDIDNDSFYCSGSVKLDGMAQPINCHNTAGHGAQSFQKALTNSCNPAFMEIGARLGVNKFCYYFDAFGLGEKTGIDLPAESSGLGFDPDVMTNVDLAVSAFGQGETVTPIEMITSYCAAINGGYLLKPYVVDKIVDEDGNVILKNERTVRRQVVSEDTSAKMRNALYHVVADSEGNGNVRIKGYAIGGKSGTSQRLSVTSTGQTQGQEDASIQEYGASYVCFTPADDPEIVLLVLADMPNKDIGYYGSVVAVPTARDILTEVLPYLGYSPQYTDEEVENLDVKIPLLEGPIDEAQATLRDLGVECEIIGSGIEVVAQSPVTGSAISKGGKVYLYTEKSHTVDYTEVPDLVGVSPSFANEQLAYCELNFVAKGASMNKANAVVSSQSIEPHTPVPKGTAIELEIMVYSDGD